MQTRARSTSGYKMAPLAIALAAAFHGTLSYAQLTSIADSPLIVASTNSVKPNLMFVLDDSGSMNFDYMPDHIVQGHCRSTGAGISSSTYTGTFTRSCCEGGNTSYACWVGSAPFSRRGHPPFLASEFNSLAYNPAIRYQPGMADDGLSERASITSWTSVPNDAYGIQNGGTINLVSGYPDILWCPSTESADSECLRNDNYILPGLVNGVLYSVYRASTSSGKGLVATGAPDKAETKERDLGPHYYRIVASEYCKDGDPSLRDCKQGSSTGYSLPAAVRWCTSDANARAYAPAAGSCQAVRTATYSHARYPTKYATQGIPEVPTVPAVPAKTLSISVSLSGCSKTKKVALGPFLVNGVDLFNGATTSLTNSSSTLAASIRSLVNASSNGGYKASGSSNNFVITAPAAAGDLKATATVFRAAGSHSDCKVTFGSPISFSGYQPEIPGTPAVPASFAGSFERVDIVPTNNSYPKAPSRTDCAGSTCTYAEEMTNFANWWAYYHSRMQLMKSSASQAFAAVPNTMRLGLAQINSSAGLQLDVFENDHRKAWFGKFFSAKPNGSTPLRTALASAGRYYAAKDTSYAGSSAAKDPMEYSCQKNFTILSTDGFWNESSNPVQIDGSTAIGDQDSSLERPQLDGTATGNTLADTAAYYYLTDLRDDKFGNCKSGSTNEDVCGTGAGAGGTNEVQNMVTLTLGLGASGFMQFRPDYEGSKEGDFFAVKQGSSANPSAGICAWQSSGACNWPVPQNNTLTTIDDLWHAAVNGGGTYFSAKDSATLYSGITALLQNIEAKVGTAAAATTSNPNITAGDNQVFISTFTSAKWTGELQSLELDVESGMVIGDNEGEKKPKWSAADLLDANTSRKIYLFDSGSSSGLRSFAWDALSATEKSYFSRNWISAGSDPLSQFCAFGPSCLTDEDQDAASGAPLLRYLAGERTSEGEANEIDKFYRKREHLLGDIVSSEAVYVKSPVNSYSDSDYAAHASSLAARAGMVYVAANDGMLHAFSAETGQELWAFVPTAVLPNMYKLADKLYANEHTYLLDGSPVIADAYAAGQWRTLLVGGMGAGGRSYYALDITNPSSPKALWEFKHDDLGLTFGKAEIGKLEDGTWVVLVPSGFNNVSPGDGKGHLFVLDAGTGKVIRKITTSEGNTSNPSGLGHITAWVDDWENEGTIRRVYGGDNMGNVWRFDINDNIAPSGYEAQRLGVLKSAMGDIQPITSKPELGEIEGRPVVMLGTGRYLGLPDLSDTKKGTIYVMKDRLTAEDFGDVRSAVNNFVEQKLVTLDSSTRAMTAVNPVNWATDNGCYVDLPEVGERVTTDPALVLGTLVVNSNVISSGNVCRVGGSSWTNFLDYRTCGPVGSVVSKKLGDAIATRPTVVKLPNNKVISLSRLANDTTVSEEVPISTKPGPTRRLSWRDLIKE